MSDVTTTAAPEDDDDNAAVDNAAAPEVEAEVTASKPKRTRTKKLAYDVPEGGFAVWPFPVELGEYTLRHKKLKIADFANLDVFCEWRKHYTELLKERTREQLEGALELLDDKLASDLKPIEVMSKFGGLLSPELVQSMYKELQDKELSSDDKLSIQEGLEALFDDDDDDDD